MELDQLLTFVTLAQLKNFNQTALFLHLAQPTVSARINALEQEFSTVLFNRTTRWVELTEAGRNLLGYAQRILEISKEMENAVQSLRSLTPSRIVIASTPTLNYQNLPRILQQLHKEFPTTKAIVKTGNTQQVLDMVVDGVAHAALVRSPVYHPEISATTLYQEDLQVIVPAKHPLTAKRPLLAADLNDHPMISHDAGSRGGAWLRKILQVKGFTPTIVMEMDYVETVKQLVASGVGFAILPVTTVERELKQGLLIGLPIADIPNLRREVTFICTKRSTYAVEVQVLSRILRRLYPPHPA